ncbi:MAG: hypothetical protein CME86_00340 [Herbaspirillum sp.]|nr:hypothetical protein [Herbaspirillum sp.]HCP03154.1 hypothetical protein [Pseudomonas sp.]
MDNIFAELVHHFKGQQKTASALGVDQSTVSGWVTGRHGMSALTALKAERITAGKFLAARLCPEIAELSEPAA